MPESGLFGIPFLLIWNSGCRYDEGEDPTCPPIPPWAERWWSSTSSGVELPCPSIVLAVQELYSFHGSYCIREAVAAGVKPPWTCRFFMNISGYRNIRIGA